MLDDKFWMISFSSCFSWVLMGSSPASSATTALTFSWLKPINFSFLRDLSSPDGPFLVAFQLLCQ